jgi:hypothetical protein
LWQRVGAVLGVLALAYTAYAAYTAPPCRQADWLLVLAVAWGVLPPLWWWIEFFFIYPRHHSVDKFEVLKHAAQASLAIWAPIAVALAAYGSSDYFKPTKPSDCLYVARGASPATASVMASGALPAGRAASSASSTP